MRPRVGGGPGLLDGGDRLPLRRGSDSVLKCEAPRSGRSMAAFVPPDGDSVEASLVNVLIEASARVVLGDTPNRDDVVGDRVGGTGTIDIIGSVPADDGDDAPAGRAPPEQSGKIAVPLREIDGPARQARLEATTADVAPSAPASGWVTPKNGQDLSEVQTTTIDPPPIGRRTMRTSVALADGQALVRGGLVTEGDTLTDSAGPGRGTLVRVRDSRHDRTERPVVIRQRVKPDDRHAGAATSSRGAERPGAGSVVRSRLGRLRHRINDPID